jgi:hypothetical protein
MREKSSMTQMLRKQIYIPRRQKILLGKLAKARGVSEAEVIRQAIEREAALSAAQPVAGDRSALEDFIRFGLSRRAGQDTTQRSWTRQELYEER